MIGTSFMKRSTEKVPRSVEELYSLAALLIEPDPVDRVVDWQLRVGVGLGDHVRTDECREHDRDVFVCEEIIDLLLAEELAVTVEAHDADIPLEPENVIVLVEISAREYILTVSRLDPSIERGVSVSVSVGLVAPLVDVAGQRVCVALGLEDVDLGKSAVAGHPEGRP